MTDQVDTCVIGAGAVGLAIARALASAGQEVLVLEKEHRFGEGVSSRNSEVIHAGIYYPKNSLKALLCVRGKALLYEYCADRHIGHERLGKLIVATSEAEAVQLEAIQARAAENGVDDLSFVTDAFIRETEPALGIVAALLSPSTGIVSAAEYMTALLGDVEAMGGSLACHAEVQSVRRSDSGFELDCLIEDEPYALACRRLINAAGLGAQAIAHATEGLDQALVPELYYCKGNYFLLQGKNPFRHLIYPVPDPSGAGLGVHATIDLAGQVKFGPDVEYIDAENYQVSEHRLQQSYEAIRRYYPSLADDALMPGYAGIRPKLQGPGDAVADFVIQDESSHGIPGLVNLFGIESPGLTSSMAIAETVQERLS